MLNQIHHQPYMQAKKKNCMNNLIIIIQIIKIKLEMGDIVKQGFMFKYRGLTAQGICTECIHPINQG